MHIAGAVLPAVVFLCYYASSNWSVILQVSGFFEAVGIAFPVVISILCAKSVALEEVGHFQTFLGTTTRRAYAFLAKWMALLILAFFAVFGAVGILAAGEWSFLKIRRPSGGLCGLGASFSGQAAFRCMRSIFF